MPWLLSTGDDDGVIKVRGVVLRAREPCRLIPPQALGPSATRQRKGIYPALRLHYRLSLVRGQKAPSCNEVRFHATYVCLYYAFSYPVFCSGDGTLSVMDIRSKKPEPVAQSEDQEDELLSIAAIKGYVDRLPFLRGRLVARNLRKWRSFRCTRASACRVDFTCLLPSFFDILTENFSGSKIVVGTQLGILSIFNRSSGWGDCVDRIPG